MKYFNALIKPASSLCNMKCNYCFYQDVSNNRECYSYGIMEEDTMKAIINQTFLFFKEETIITFAFQGGEPTLAGIDFFKKFIDYSNENKKEYHFIRYSIQTNGYLLSEEWFQLFEENNFLVGISLDGYKEIHDSLRRDNKNQNTYEIILRNINEMKKRNISFNILTVLTHQLSIYPKEIFNFYKVNNLNVLQFIPCLPAFNQKTVYECTPQDFYKFYDQLFELWFKEYLHGNYISINYFDNLIRLFKGLPPVQCGGLGFCTMQFVIESNGNVYPCDFYCVDEYKVGNIKENKIQELICSSTLSCFIYQEKRLFKDCGNCKYQNICNGNCKRMNVCYFDDDFCALQAFLKKHEQQLILIANFIRI